MELSIIIPVFNQHQFTKQILDDIPNKIKSQYEIIVIDNGSDQLTKNLLKQYDNITLIQFPQNEYVTKAWNIWVRVARWKYIMVCNNDITFPEWIDKRLIQEYDWRIVWPMIHNIGDSHLTCHTWNINWTCLVKFLKVFGW